MKSTLLSIMIFTIALMACNDNCIQGDGSSVIEDRDVGSYTIIDNSTIANIVISDSMDLANVIELIGEQNIIDQINTNFSGNSLAINNESSCLSSTGSLELRLYRNNISEINNSGTGDISGQVSSTNLTIDNDGTGNILISGIPNNSIDITNESTGDIRVDLIESQNVVVDNSGTGDIYVNALASLSGSLSGTGDIYYKGSPVIDVTSSGTGEIIDNNWSERLIDVIDLSLKKGKVSKELPYWP